MIHLPPISLLDSARLKIDLTDIEDSPDTPDGGWAVWQGPGNTLVRVGFDRLPTVPAVGEGGQSFRFWVRKSAAGGNNCIWDMQLWEAGKKLAHIGAGMVTSEVGEMVEVQWDGVRLKGGGLAVEVQLEQLGGGLGPDGRGLEIGAVDWVATSAPNAEVYVEIARAIELEVKVGD